ncbi:hypothetical protein BASA50_010132 [Batrachochytrium salamandrivorans]|uniref:Uncharacterized protein n=1 Tax=Batrachochytrium salamandrivorans TaxID=1357716 RepID=A0ABQ8EZ87_9FUNG|nr:hypothetical protein BASA50_010132 [Batrachochytrium salamandrivorans]
MYELWCINSLLKNVLKNTVKIKKVDYTPAYKVIQNDAIQRSIGYLQELADIGERMAKALCIIPQKSTFKDRSRLLESVFKAYDFKAGIKNALRKGPNNRRKYGKGRKGRKGMKGREDLVTSKEKLDNKKKILHRIAIPENGGYNRYHYDDDSEDDDSDNSEDDDDDDDEYY